jgi:predicted GNAT family N-acyltransferase
VTAETDVEIRRVRTESDLSDALAVRRAVFVDEQGVPPDLEVDAYDDLDAATHVVAFDDGRAIGAARLRPYHGGDAADESGDTAEESDDTVDEGKSPARAKVERVAVLADRRGEGIGARLMDAIETAAREQGVETLVLHAQTPVEGFYTKRGYETVGEEFEEAGIPHVEMVREA